MEHRNLDNDCAMVTTCSLSSSVVVRLHTGKIFAVYVGHPSLNMFVTGTRALPFGGRPEEPTTVNKFNNLHFSRPSD